jgi:regulator of nucleoside diphosphate kinase
VLAARNRIQEDKVDHSLAMEHVPEIKITQEDLTRLGQLLAAHKGIWSWKAAKFLIGELSRSTVVGENEIPADTVTMRTQVEYREDGDENSRVVTLVYPGERDAYDDAISVLTPVGAALIGLSVGQTISYAAPDGSPKALKVLRILYQPEASRRAATATIRRSARPLLRAPIRPSSGRGIRPSR